MEARLARRPLETALCALLSMALPACGTIMLRPRQVVEVRSRPAGAMVALEDTDRTWVTPARFRLLREGGPYRLIVSKEGHRSRAVTLQQEISEWTWVGMALTLGAGYLVDRMTGSRYDLEPARTSFDLVPLDAERTPR